LGVFPLDQIAYVEVSPSIYLKLISREIISKYPNVCDHGIDLNVTDRQTDGQTTYSGVTALCVASHGKIG